MTMPLRAYQPDPEIASPAQPFRSDCATIAHVLAWYAANNPLRSKCAKSERERARLYALLDQVHGDRRCADCKPHVLLDLINEHAGDNAWTRRRWNATIQRPFNFAARLGLIDKNPFHGLTFPEGAEGRDWTDAEYQTLLRLATPRIRRLIVWIRFSGMRPGEIRDLVWTAIKPEARKIVLHEHKTAAKTRTPRRIPINHVMAKMLAWIRRHSPPSTHVFLNTFGNPYSMKAVTKTMATLRAKAGMADDVKMHGGRHTFATHALVAGVDLLELMQLLGHADVRTTQRYVHLADKADHLNSAMEKAIGRPKNTEQR